MNRCTETLRVLVRKLKQPLARSVRKACIPLTLLEYFMKLNTKSALILSTLLAGTAAIAQTKAPAPDYTLSYNVGAVSNYVFRGITQTAANPAIQGGVAGSTRKEFTRSFRTCRR